MPGHVKARGAAPGGVRAARARQNRRVMVEAAYELFCAHGYEATTLTQIAQKAGVAVQTLYFTFGTKSGLLQECFVHAVLGPEPMPPHLQPWYRKMLRTDEVQPAISLAVKGSVVIFHRIAPLITSMSRITADASAAAVAQSQEDLRRKSYREIIDIWATKRPLRPGINIDAATDITLVLLSADTYHQFVAIHGWSAKRYSTWLTTTLYQQLFDTDC